MSARKAGGVLLGHAGGGGVFAAQLIAPEADGRWIAAVGRYVGGAVNGARQSINVTEWKTAGEVAAAIESQR
jgi:hypothetical protein